MEKCALVPEEHKESFYELRRIGSEELKLNGLLLGGGNISVLEVLE